MSDKEKMLSSQERTTLLPAVHGAVKSLNARYGYGDVQAVRVFLDGRIEFVVKGFKMSPQTRRGHLVSGRTVKVLGHQLTIRRT